MRQGMRMLRFTAAALAVLLLLAAGTAAAEEQKDQLAWMKDNEIQMIALRFNDPYIGVSMPAGRGCAVPQSSLPSCASLQ